MSGQVSPYAVANVLMAGLAAHQEEVGKSQSALDWNCDRKTASNWISGKDPCDPSAFSVAASIAHEVNQTGGSEILADLNRLISGTPGGDAMKVDSDALKALAELGELFREDALSLQGDSHVSLQEAARLLPLCDRGVALLVSLSAHLRDKLRRQAP